MGEKAYSNPIIPGLISKTFWGLIMWYLQKVETFRKIISKSLRGYTKLIKWLYKDLSLTNI